jgi:hypothetical protein
MEHEEQSEKLSRELDRLDEHSDEVGEQIDEARREWESNEEDKTVPGAQPDPETPERSDQLPEEAPAEHVHDDGGDSSGHEPPGVPGEEGTATGNPDAAGSDEGDQAGD